MSIRINLIMVLLVLISILILVSTVLALPNGPLLLLVVLRLLRLPATTTATTTTTMTTTSAAATATTTATTTTTILISVCMTVSSIIAAGILVIALVPIFVCMSKQRRPGVVGDERVVVSSRCTSALALGSGLILSPRMYVLYCGPGMLSPRGRCFTYDSSADGYARRLGPRLTYWGRLGVLRSDVASRRWATESASQFAGTPLGRDRFRHLGYTWGSGLVEFCRIATVSRRLGSEPAGSTRRQGVFVRPLSGPAPRS